MPTELILWHSTAGFYQFDQSEFPGLQQATQLRFQVLYQQILHVPENKCGLSIHKGPISKTLFPFCPNFILLKERQFSWSASRIQLKSGISIITGVKVVIVRKKTKLVTLGVQMCTYMSPVIWKNLVSHIFDNLRI
jgi:hypothetical protein